MVCASSQSPINLDPQYSISVTGSVWGSQQLPIMVEPGTVNNPFTVYLTNLGSIPAQNINITLSLSYPFSSSEHSENISNSMLELLPTATLPLTFYLNIAPNSSTGVYPLPLEVEYLQSGVSYAYSTEVQLPVTTSANLTVQNAFWGSPSSPTLVGAGTGYASLILNVKNAGDNTAYNASLTIDLSKPFYYYADGFETDETTRLGVVPAGSMVPAAFTVSVDSNVSIGEYPMNVTLAYNSGIVYNQTVYVPVLGSPNIVEQSYAVQQGNVFPGDINVGLSVYLVNSGNLTANNVQAELLIPSPLSPSAPGSDRMNVGTLPPAQPLSVKFFFNVPNSVSSPLNLEFPLQMSYSGHESTYYLPLTISGMSDFTRSDNNVQNLDQGSSDVSVSLLLTNVGNVTAKDIDAQLLLPNDLSGTTLTFLGNMASKASSLANFALDVSSSAVVGTYHCTLRVTWLQDNGPGRQFSQDIPVAFQVHQSLLSSLESDFTETNLLYVAVLVIVVIAVVIGARIIVARRRK
jgi:hypothetical protein